MRYLLLFSLLFLTTACATSMERGHGLEYTFHREVDLGPLTADSLQRQLLSMAKEHQADTPAKRLTYAAVTLPKTAEEYQAMNGFALVWITALTHDKAELPPRNVRLFTHRTGIVYLNTVATFQTRETNPNITKVMGQYRFDGVYLVPFYMETLGARVVADFQDKRNSYLLTTVDAIPPAAIGQLSSIQNGGIIPDRAIIVPMVDRAFPILRNVALRQREQAKLKAMGLLHPPGTVETP